MAAQIFSSVSIDSSDGSLSKYSKDPKPDKIREMRRDPTIRLARLMVRAPILSTPWSVECDDASLQGAANEIVSMVEPHRFKILQSATMGLIDFGWQAYEKVFEIRDGYFKLKRLKPLLQDCTRIVIDEDGNIAGVINEVEDDKVELDTTYAMVLNMDTECDYHYGLSYMASVERSYDSALRIMRCADVYDKKIAGAHWVIYFPDGKSNYNGEEVTNDVIAKDLINKLENSGSFAIPYQVRDVLEQLNDNKPGDQAWVVDLKESTGSGANFEERLGRCDREKVRAFGLPERSILEGQFGTKAEADSHADFAIVGIELLHYSIVQQVNTQLIDQLVRLNFGEQYVGKIYLKNQPLSDASKAFLQSVYQTILSNNDGFLNELSSIDFGAIRDRLSIPYVETPDVPNPTNP